MGRYQEEQECLKRMASFQTAIEAASTAPEASKAASTDTSSSSSSSGSSSDSGSSESEDSSGSDSEESVSSNGGTPAAELLSEHRKLKAELFELITVNEMLNDEVKWGKQRLLTLNMDNYFLMERLLSHEKPPARKYNKRKKKGEECDSRQTDHGQHHEDDDDDDDDVGKKLEESVEEDDDDDDDEDYEEVVEIEDLDPEETGSGPDIQNPPPSKSKHHPSAVSRKRKFPKHLLATNNGSSPSSSDVNDDG